MFLVVRPTVKYSGLPAGALASIPPALAWYWIEDEPGARVGSA